MTQQPDWKFVANLGDASPLEHGGYFVYEDTTGVYGFEAERVEPLGDDEDDEEGDLQIHRVCLDRLKEVREGNTLYLVPFGYAADWPHPVSRYVVWFADDLAKVASFVDSTADELRRMLCSEDGRERAEAYRNIYDYHGWENGDSEPLTLTRNEAKARYSKGEI